jgi:hypothetical protein
MILLLSFLLSGTADAQSIQPTAVVKNISIFRNEIELNVDKNNPMKSGAKIIAKTAVNHKCLLVVKRVARDLAYADATQCPGYATLKKGQVVTETADDEVNEEVKKAPPSPLDNKDE